MEEQEAPGHTQSQKGSVHRVEATMGHLGRIQKHHSKHLGVKVGKLKSK